MSTNINTIPNERVTPLASKYALASILENYNNDNPVDIGSKILLNENDSSTLIDKLASSVKFKEINGDQNNSFDEGSDDKKIEPDENGNYVGKGKTTIFDRDINLTDPEKSTERWVETPTGKVSDGETEQVPNLQGFDNLNENEASLGLKTTEETLLESHQVQQPHPMTVIKNILNYNF